MQPFTSVTGVAVPYLQDDVNTDQIAPVQMARKLKPDYADLLFKRTRARADGSLDPDFPLNRRQFRNSSILVVGRNFGCGSSREAAVWSMLAVGIRCIVGRSLADIYRENCLQNGLLPVELPAETAGELERRVIAADGAQPFTVDLVTQKISGSGGADIAFDIAPADRIRLLEGLDDIGLTLKHDHEIAAWEARIAREMPWMQSLRDSRNGSKEAG